VAVCLFDLQNGVGGMNHILLPGKASFKDFNEEARFGINAMELLINAMMKLGGDRKNFMSKVFGGAYVVPALSEQDSVGKRNIEFVMEFLRRERIEVVKKDLGGYKSRKIFFHTDTGLVYLRRGQTLASRRIAELEQEKLKTMRLNLERLDGVVLFQK
jgi:chemotaxis protein CheD